jgi:GNAT superfamily N-acetyltransferase
MNDPRDNCALRAATADDARRLADIHCEARTAAMPWLPVLHSKNDVVLWMGSTVLAEQHVFVAMRGTTAVGFVAMTPGWVEQLYVAPECWRTGAGAVLLQQAKQQLSDGFRLWTFQRNAMARAFYRKHGLTEIRTTDGQDNEEAEPDVLLGWKLTS